MRKTLWKDGRKKEGAGAAVEGGAGEGAEVARQDDPQPVEAGEAAGEEEERWRGQEG